MPTGGDLIADVLVSHGVRTLFTLCGGHISPILVSSRQRDIRIVDTRHEAAAVFAADAEARLSGRPGVAAVTAGPGITNTITALKNAQLAASPLVVFCGATATILKGRGSLQDIDQEALLLPHVKWFASARRVKDLAPLVREAFTRAQEGVPGPTAIECPVDLLYAEEVVRQLYGLGSSQPRSLAARLQARYLQWHVRRLFSGVESGARSAAAAARAAPRYPPAKGEITALSKYLDGAQRPVLLVGSQALVAPTEVGALAEAVTAIGMPTYLSGMARGLLGASHALQRRHQRKQALREADLVLLAGVPCDFRLDYGRHINAKATVVSLNRSEADLRKNRRPTLAIQADPDLVLRTLAERASSGPAPNTTRRWSAWQSTLAGRDAEREREIDARAGQAAAHVNPLALFRAMDAILPVRSTLVADGGDFVATASYIVRPRRPLSWLDPGVFGTLGVGGGFALGAHAVDPSAELWVIWGDGAAGYSLTEFDSFVRHRVPVVAIVGNDASWAQIAREQVDLLGESTGTDLRHSDYHLVAQGLGGKGLLLDRPGAVTEVLAEARQLARDGHPVLVNAILDRTDFRKGSLSM